jgi:hypothetical protein
MNLSISDINLPDEVTDGNHDNSAALELGSDNTGDQEGDDLERSTSAVQESGIESTESKTLCVHKDGISDQYVKR